MTIHGVPDEVDESLKELSRVRGISVNAAVLEILAEAFGVSERRRRLERYGTWEVRDREAFDAALAEQRAIDDDLRG